MERRRVLLVEDSPTQAERLRLLLESDDLEVSQVGTGEAALEQLRKRRADVILLDYHLPGMNGDEFCREIRLNVNTRAIPILMLTVEGSDSALVRGLDSGADDYLAKSADPDVLRYRVRALLRKTDELGSILETERIASKARVLAIDDSPTYLYYLARELKTENYIVETVDSPKAALERIEQMPFDCVLVDFQMPELDGAEVCRRIRHMRREAEHELVLIMLTSHEDKEHMALGFEAGADDYIAKSADIAVTKSRIRALLRRKSMVEENHRIFEELRQKELQTIRARAERQAAEIRAELADQLAAANRGLEDANRKLDTANQELERFAYSAAHDLQEPLRMVILYSQLLQSRYEGKLDNQADQFIEYCVEGGRRMDRLIKDLLLYARAASSDEESRKASDLNELCDKAIANLTTAIDESHARVTRSELPTLFVEGINLQQLFQNLIGNALKYRRPDVAPEVRIEAERIEDDWRFSVADNGIGIAPEYLDKVFGVFKRFHTDPQYSGTGLGLAICQRIIDRHGGRIWVDSKVNQGTTFFFTLPKSLEQQPSSSAA